jgi:hypothetical protein
MIMDYLWMKSHPTNMIIMMFMRNTYYMKQNDLFNEQVYDLSEVCINRLADIFTTPISSQLTTKSYLHSEVVVSSVNTQHR